MTTNPRYPKAESRHTCDYITRGPKGSEWGVCWICGDETVRYVKGWEMGFTHVIRGGGLVLSDPQQKNGPRAPLARCSPGGLAIATQTQARSDD